MQLITVNHGATTLTTPCAALALQVLTGLVGGAPANTTPAADFIPAIGQYWPGQGGVNAGLMRGEDGHPDYWLIVPDIKAKKLAYGGYKIESAGVDSRRDGAANTKALVESDTDHPAAQWCAGLEVEGHNDLHLPAINELALCMANVPELFEKQWHLSSTQRSAIYAFCMDFAGGYQHGGGKDFELSVRPVRRFIR